MESLDQRINSEKVAVLHPVVFAMRAHQLDSYCSYCHNWLTNHPSYRLPCLLKCEFVWYCSPDCRDKDFQDVHQYECQLFTETNVINTWKSDDLEMPDSDKKLAILRLALKWHRAGLCFERGALTGKSIMEWPDVAENGRTKLQVDEAVTKLAQSTISLLSFTFPEEFEGKKAAKLVEALIRKVYHRLHFLFAKHIISVVRVGVALDLDLPFFTQCCGPNAEVYWSGRVAYVVPFFSDVRATSLSQVAISPVDVTLPKALRRTTLEQFGVIGCECERCANKTEFDASLKCQFCDASQVHFDLPFLVHFEEKSKQSKLSKRQTASKEVYCVQCQKVQTDEYVSAAVKVMHEIGQFYYAGGIKPEARNSLHFLAGKTVASEQWTSELLQKAEKYLCPDSNLFYFQLLVISLFPLKSYEPTWMQRAQHYFRILSFWVPQRFATGRTDALQVYTEMLRTFSVCQVWDAAAILLGRIYGIINSYFVDNLLPRELARATDDFHRVLTLGMAHNVPLDEERREEIERSFMVYLTLTSHVDAVEAAARDVEAREQAETRAMHSQISSLLSQNGSDDVINTYYSQNNNVDGGLEDFKETEILNSMNLQSSAARQRSASGVAGDFEIGAKRGQSEADAPGPWSPNASEEGAQNGDLEDGFLSALNLNENPKPKKSQQKEMKKKLLDVDRL